MTKMLIEFIIYSYRPFTPKQNFILLLGKNVSKYYKIDTNVVIIRTINISLLEILYKVRMNTTCFRNYCKQYSLSIL